MTDVVDRLTSEASDRGEGALSGFTSVLTSNILGEKDFILDFVLALLVRPAARIIRSRIWNGLLSGDIASSYARLSADQPTTPPPSHPSFTSSFQQTPWSFNTGSFADASEHRKHDVLREEILPTLLHPRRLWPYPPTRQASRDGIRSMSRGRYPALHQRQRLEWVAPECRRGPRPGVAARLHGVDE